MQRSNFSPANKLRGNGHVVMRNARSMRIKKSEHVAIFMFSQGGKEREERVTGGP